MPSVETIRLLTVRGRSDGLDRLATDIGRVSDAQRDAARSADTVAQSTDNLSRKQISVAQAWERQQARADAAVRAQQQFDREMRVAAQAFDQGILGAKAYSAELERLATNLQNAGTTGIRTPSVDPNTLLGTRAPETGSARASADAMQEAFEEQERMARAATLLRQQIDPLGAAQARFNAELVEYRGLAASGVITTNELAAAEAQAQARLDMVGRAMKGAGTEAGLAGYQWKNLALQGNDAVTMLLSGSGAFQILATQGGQVVQVLQDANGGLVGGIKAVGAGLLGLVTPGRLALGGLAALVIEGATAWSRYDDQQRTVGITLSGLGRTAGVTASSLTSMSHDWAAAAGLSTKSALDLGAALAGTGKLGADNIGKIISVSKDLSTTLGQDMGQVKDTLVRTFSEPQAGILALDRQLNFLSARQIGVIEGLFRQGQAQNAISVALAAMPSSLAKYEQSTSAVGKAWDAVKVAASNADQAVGSLINRVTSGPNLTSRVRELATELDHLQKLNDATVERAPWDPAGRSGRSVVSPTAPTVASTTSSPLRMSVEDEMNFNIEDIRRGSQSAFNEERTATIASWSKQIEGFLVDLPRVHDDYNKLVQQKKAFDDALKSPALMNEVKNLDDFSTAADIIVQKQKAMQDGNGQLMSSEERAAEVTRLRLQLAGEFDTAAKTEIQTRINRLTLGQQNITQGEAENRVTEDGRMLLEQRRIALTEDVRAMDLQSTTYGKVGTAREIATQLLDKELQYRRSGMQLSSEEISAFEQRIAATVQMQQVQAQLDKLYTDFLAPARDLNNIIQAGAKLFADGSISATQYANAIADAKVKALEAQGTLRGGIEAGLLKTSRDFGDVSKNAESFVTSSASTIASSLADITSHSATAGDGFKQMGSTIVRSLEEMVIKMLVVAPIMRGLQSIIGGGAADYAKAAASAAPGMYGPGFADGGYTGSGGKYEPAGIVHRGEFVFDAEATRRIGVDTLDSWRRGLPGYAEGGYVAPPMLPWASSPSDPRDRRDSGGPAGEAQQVNISVDVTGATGNEEVQRMVALGVAQGIKAYRDKGVRQDVQATVRGMTGRTF